MTGKMIRVTVLAVAVLLGCSKDPFKTEYPKKVVFSLNNRSGMDRSDAPVILEIKQIRERAPDFNPDAFLAVMNGREIPSQVQDWDLNGEADRILVTADFGTGKTAPLSVYYAPSGRIVRHYAKRTQAELSVKTGGRFVDRRYIGGAFGNVQKLRVPPEHTDHSNYIRYEGPGWESDRVGYRFYLDWRNAIDIFGKKTTGMVLQNVGQDGLDSYHNLADWGADIYSVGSSLGIGSIAVWHEGRALRVEKTDSITCVIADNGPVYSRVRTLYYGWQAGDVKVDLISDLSIWAGSRITDVELEVDGSIDNLCTGLAKAANTVFFKGEHSGEKSWGYIAQWGRQSLVGETDELGIAVFYPKDALMRLDEDELNHVVILKPADGRVRYCFAAAWIQEPGGIRDREAFENYLDRTAGMLASEIAVVNP